MPPCAKNPVIQRHHANHPGIYAPAWKTIEFMTIGNIITLYDSLKEPEAKDLVANAYGCSRGVFYNYMETIRVLRNKCAHGSCIYRMDFPKGIKRLPAGISVDCRHNIKGGIDVVKYILGCISQAQEKRNWKMRFIILPTPFKRLKLGKSWHKPLNSNVKAIFIWHG